MTRKEIKESVKQFERDIEKLAWDIVAHIITEELRDRFDDVVLGQLADMAEQESGPRTTVAELRREMGFKNLKRIRRSIGRLNKRMKDRRDRLADRRIFLDIVGEP